MSTSASPRAPNPNPSITTNPTHAISTSYLPVPTPQPHEALIHIRATGICGSDVHFARHGRIGPSVIDGEQVLGHESAGEVVAVGVDVTEVEIGDRVALEPGMSCLLPSCAPCTTGRYNLCSRCIFYSSPPVPGTMRRCHAHPAAWLHKLPSALNFEEGALLEPLSVALAGLERGGVRLGNSVVVSGAGPVGLLCLLTAAAAGAGPVVVADLEAGRLGVARGLVPRARTVRVTRGQDPEEVARGLKAALGGEADVVMECSGVEASVWAGCYAARPGGTVLVIGVSSTDSQSYPFQHVSMREIDLKFQFRYCNTWPKAIKLVEEGMINLKPLVTHRFGLEEAKKAFEAASNASSGAIKVLIVDE